MSRSHQTLSLREFGYARLPYSGKFSRAQIFANHQKTRQGKNFAIFIFATRSRLSDHTPYNFPHVNGDLQRVFQLQNDGKTLACLSKRVGCCWQRTAMPKGGSSDSEDLFAVTVMTGELWSVIIGSEKFTQFARCIVRGVLYYPCWMVLRQIFYRFTGSATQTHCAWRPQLVNKKILKEEIFTGTNFRELAFDRKNRKNFCLAKISHYTVFYTIALAQ